MKCGMISFLCLDKNQNCLQDDTNILGGLTHVCQDIQSNCRILRRALSQKGRHVQGPILFYLIQKGSI